MTVLRQPQYATRAILAAVLSLLLVPTATMPAPAGKRLIEFGWDEPDPRFMRTHLAQLQASPFDGCVYHVNYRTALGDSGNFTWELWGRRRFTAAELADAGGGIAGIAGIGVGSLAVPLQVPRRGAH